MNLSEHDKNDLLSEVTQHNLLWQSMVLLFIWGESLIQNVG